MSFLPKALLALSALSGSLLIGAIWALTPPSAGNVSQEIKHHLLGGAEEIRLSGMTAFHWTEVILLPPYTDRKEVCIALQLSNEACLRNTPEAIDEGQFFFVFKHGPQVVHSEYHERSNGDFRLSKSPSVYPAIASTFKVTRERQPDGRIWYYLHHSEA